MTLRLDQVCFTYPAPPRGVRRVLDRVSLEVGADSSGITAVVGPNGAGKSTLLRLMLGLIRPASGSVRWDDTDCHRLSPLRRAQRGAYIAQQPYISAGFSVREVVALGRFAVGHNDDAAFRAMDRLDVLDRRDDPFWTLSAGQQQRVSIARAIAQLDPLGRPATDGRVLLADEPFSALDPSHAATVGRVFRESARSGISVVVVLHDLTAAARLADRVVMLDAAGTVAADGPPSEVLSPDRLRRVFGVDFESLTGAGGPVVVRAESAQT